MSFEKYAGIDLINFNHLCQINVPDKNIEEKPEMLQARRTSRDIMVWSHRKEISYIRFKTEKKIASISDISSIWEPSLHSSMILLQSEIKSV